MSGETALTLALALLLFVVAPGCSKCAPRPERTHARSDRTQAPRAHPRAATISAHDDHTCVVLEDKTVRCWGRGAGGAIGDGKQDGDDGSPHDVGRAFAVMGTPRIVRVAARSLGTAAVAEDGSVWSWGYWFFFLGDGTPPGWTNELLPQKRSFSGSVKQIEVAFEHACALLSDGHVECWGRGNEGQLGNGALASAHAPERVRGVAGAVHIAAGGGHSCAIVAGGSVVCWGLDPKGRSAVPPEPAEVEAWKEHVGPAPAPAGGAPPHPDLHQRPPGPRPAFDRLPRSILGLGAAVQIVTASRGGTGEEFTCVRDEAGHVSCWGFNGLGQLGDASRVDSAEPKRVPGLDAVVDLAASGMRACAVERSGRVLCWGDPIDPNDARPAPREVPGISDASQIALGERHACAVSRDGDVTCWGANDHAQLGRSGDGGFEPERIDW